MTVGQFLYSSTQKLRNSGITSARLDCLILLEDSLLIDRANLIAHPEKEIPPLTEVELNNKIVQRSQHTPLAYIRGKVEFFNRQFSVNSDVLVPRPETEDIINLTLKVDINKAVKIADIGTGSGCIGISAALELPNAQVDLYDISPKALEVARHNALSLNAQIHVFKSDLLNGLHQDYDIILTNLPYVPDNHPINQAAGMEPRLALFAGNDGMDLYRKLWQQIGLLRIRPAYIITESLKFQHKLNSHLANSQGYVPVETVGLAQAFKLK